MRRFWPFVATCLALVLILSAAGLHALEQPSAELRAARAVPCAPGWDRWRDRVSAWLFPADDPEATLQRLGGTRIIFRLDADNLRRAMLVQLRNDARRLLSGANIGHSIVMRDGGVEVGIRDDQKLQQALTKLAATSVKLSPSLDGTVDVRRIGDHVVRLAPTEPAVDDRIRVSRQLAIEFIQGLVKGFGNYDAVVQTEGSDRIRVLLPGVKNPEGLPQLIMSVSHVAFRLIDTSIDAIKEAMNGRVPADSEMAYELKTKSPYLVRKGVVATGHDLAEVTVACDGRTREPIIALRFDARGTRSLAQVSHDNVGRPIAVLLNEQIISAPVIEERIPGGASQISGTFTREDADNLAALLKAGMLLPPRLVVIEHRIIEAASPADHK